jgi:hypothetical protein
MAKEVVSEEQKARMEVAFRELEQLSGDAQQDFPELFEDEKEIDETQHDYLKKAMIEEIIDNVEVKEDNSISDKRLKRSLFKRILDALFG